MDTSGQEHSKKPSGWTRAGARGQLVRWGAATVIAALVSTFAYVRASSATQDTSPLGISGATAVTEALNQVALPVEGELPPLNGAVQWLNSPPLTQADLRGKVVVLNVWTYSCINSLRALPYVNAWSQKYKDQGLVVIGVHAPEFGFEHDGANVQQALKDLGIAYPNALDNHFAIWHSLGNEYWPALYFADAQGRIRHHSFGEGDYANSETVVRTLLAEAGHPEVAKIAPGLGNTPVPGVEAAADERDLRSPETYFGYAEAERFESPGGERPDVPNTYVTPGSLSLNHWGLDGVWQVSSDRATLDKASGRVVYRFHARDLHLVLGTGADQKPVRFRVTVDGVAPGNAHGVDVAPDGTGTVTEHRLYQLVRQPNDVRDHTFEIEFLDPGVEAYSFTFG
jgi:thiol-disulfide isomerase/thioredoxin